jgi:hypothetical protein
LLDIYPDVAAAVAAFETSGGRRFER